MDARTYKKFMVVVTAAMGALIALGLKMKHALIPALTIMVGAVALQYLQRRIDDYDRDERTVIIYEKASNAALRVFALGAMAVGTTLIVLSDTYPAYEQLGYTLAYLTCALLMLQLAFHSYYSRKYGG